MARQLEDTAAGGYTSKPHAASMPKYEGFNVRENQFAYNPASLNIPRAPDSGAMAAFDRASVRLDRIAEKVQAEQDDARVTEAITDLRRHATDLEAGENGWRKLLQANALEPDAEGKGLVERVDTDMRSYGDKIGEKLTGRQRAMFNRHAMNVYQSVYGGVSGHVATQGMEYQKGVYSSAIDFEIEAAAANGYKLEALKNSEERLLQNVDKLADLLGIPQDQKENYRRKYVSSLYANAIDGIMSNSGPNPAVGFTALGLLRKNSHKMLGSDVNRLRRSIDAACKEAEQQRTLDKFKAQNSGYVLMQNGEKVREIQSEHGVVLNVSEGDASAVEDFTVGVLHGLGKLQTDTSEIAHDGQNFSARSRYGASNVSLENAYEIDKNVDSKRLLDDKAYNIQTGVRVYTEHLRQFAGDKQMAFAAYYSSPREVRAAQKAAEESPDGTGNWFDKMPKNVQEKVTASMKALDDYSSAGVKGPDGKTINSFTPQAFKAQAQWQTPVQLEKWLLENDPRARTDPSYRRSTLGGLIAKQQREKQEYTQRQENLLAQVSDTLYANGGNPSSVPPQLWAQLTRKQQMDAMAVSEKLQKGEDTTNPAVAALYTDDNNLRELSVKELGLLQSSYSAKDYKVLKSRWFKLQADGKAAQEKAELARIAGVRGEVLPDFVPASAMVKQAMAAVPALAELKNKDSVAFNNAAQVFMTAIAIEGQVGKAPIKSEFAVMDSVKRMTNAMGGADPGKLASFFGTKAEGLPKEGRTDVYFISKHIAWKRFGHDPSDLEILTTAQDVLLNRYAITDLRGMFFDEATTEKVRADYRAVKGKDPVGSEFIRGYFYVRVSKDAPPLKDSFNAVARRAFASSFDTGF